MNFLENLRQQNYTDIFKKYGIAIALLIVLSFSVTYSVQSAFSSFGYKISSALFPANPSTVEVRNLLIGGLKNMNQLTTVNTATKATVVVNKDQKFTQWITLGNTKVIYEGVGQVQAGLDMQDVVVKSVNPEQHEIHLLLPPPYLSDVFLDIDKSQVVDKYRNWFGPNAEADLQEKAQKMALAQIKAEACANGILAVANENAKTSVEQILLKAKFEHITIDTQTPAKNACLAG